ncbi:MAG: UDP-N-acetylmuramate dehydrogenase [Candidatus Saccharimonadales bacterium]
MFIQETVSLQTYSTMQLGGNAAYVAEVSERSDIPELVDWAVERKLPIIMIGSGSNIVWRDEGFDGLVLVNKIMQFETQENEDFLYVTVGAGENWDDVVRRTVELGYDGIAELSLIPGTAGGTPIQNVGAYGREISEVLISVEAFDLKTMEYLNIPAMDCGFSYRSSRFKTTDRDRFLITKISFQLTKQLPKPPFYDALNTYFDKNNVIKPTVQNVRDAVIAIRTAKLPDPADIANNGSFFGNPIVAENLLAQLLSNYPMLRYWRNSDGTVKLSAAWLIEQAGFKDYHDSETGMATWSTQPLVLVNEQAKTTADLLTFKQKIVDKVHQKFGVELTQEPELLP